MKTKQNYIPLVILIIGVLALLIFANISAKEKPAIGISGYYDKDGNLIQGVLSVVSGIEGVEYITIEVNALNKDKVPLDFTITDATPIEFKENIDITQSITTQPDATAQWESGLVPISSFEGTTQTLSLIHI